MKKIMSFILILCICTSLFLTACSNANTNSDANANISDTNTNSNDDAMNLLKKSSDYYNNVKNVKIDNVINSVMIYNDMFTGEPVICGTKLDVTTVMHNAPYRFTSDILSTFDDTIEDGGITYIMQNNTKTTQHGVSEDEKISIYQFINDEWLKVGLEKDEFVLNDTLGLNYVTNYNMFVTEGKIVGNEVVDDINTIKAEFTLDEEYAKLMYKKYGFEEFAKLVDSKNTDKAILEMMKDATFKVWFNENNDEIVKIEVDLTSLMDTFRKVVIEDNKKHLSEDRYDYLNKCADKIAIKNTIKFSNVDNNEDFELPKKAKEAKVYGQ